MFNRKRMVALYTTIIAMIVLNVVESVLNGGWEFGIFVFSMFVIPVIFVYGIIYVKYIKFRKWML